MQTNKRAGNRELRFDPAARKRYCGTTSSQTIQGHLATSNKQRAARVLTSTYTQTIDPIDAVITWVNGSSPEHQRRRAHFAKQAAAPLLENAVNPHRWADNDEILFCLRSVANHAPWVRTIWIVTDGARPDLSELPDDLCAKIRYADHSAIFAGFPQALPTFNSLAIESLLWRIDGLSERFLYFNDDVFLSAPLHEDDVFRADHPVLRGRWVDYSDIANDPVAQRDPALFNHVMQVNAARLMHFSDGHLFAAAHVVHPFRRSVMAQLFEQHQTAFRENVLHRFRDLSQFLPQGLHNHACIIAKEAVFQPFKDHLHIHSGQGADGEPQDMRAYLEMALQAGPKFLCVNDLPQLELLVPDVRDWITAAIGGLAR